VSLATELLNLVLATDGVRLSREIADDAEGSLFPGIKLPDGQVHGVRTEEVRSWIAQIAWLHFHVVPSASTINSVTTVLAGLALFGNKEAA
jgi:hypothetical protein